MRRSLRLAHPRPGTIEPDELHCIKRLRLPVHGGTLLNGRVYLTIASIESVGLFAGALFGTGEPVTRYCDFYRDERTHSGDTSHGRRSGTPGVILEGMLGATRIGRGDLAFRRAQSVLPPQDRVHLGPGAWVPQWQHDIIVNGGIGYMANTSLDRSKHNVRIQRVTVAAFLDTQVLVAIRPIAPHEEIISPYNNTDMRCI